jgi:hypothetical protein
MDSQLERQEEEEELASNTKLLCIKLLGIS